MGRDNQPKRRQQARKLRKEAQRAPYPRILIVSEGSKTEPHYFEEIRAAYRLHSANVQVQPSALGTEPIQVVEYAQQLFEQGDIQKGIRPRSFDRVYAVFDRDDHRTYFDALGLAESLNKSIRNDERDQVEFRAVASVPCFELWLLLHFEDLLAPIHRDEVMRRLKSHMPDYEKGGRQSFADTRSCLDQAMKRATALANRFNAHSAPEPYTAVHELVESLITLKGGKKQ